MTTFTSHEDGMPCWVDVMVDSEEQHHDLRAFLSALFDWTWTLGGPEMGYYSIASMNDAAVMGLGRNEGAKGTATTYLTTSDIDAAVQRGIDLGATSVMPATQVMDLGHMAMMIDPTGASVGLWQPGTFHGFGVQYEENAPGWFDHVSSDPQKAGEFYAALTGHQLNSLEGDMRILQNGEQWFASLSNLAPGEGPQWKPIFVVDSLERIHEVVSRHGGAILLAEMPVPGSAICVFTEPVNGTSMTVMRGGQHPD
jgi:predicted enzyme related to lactoylglutathione lyase